MFRGWPTVELLFEEAFDKKDGWQSAVDRLTEYFLVLLLRSSFERGLVQCGILTALSDLHLAKALAVMHEQPERTWKLADLARVAGMSRTRFAAHFLTTLSQTPFELWRLGIA